MPGLPQALSRAPFPCALCVYVFNVINHSHEYSHTLSSVNPLSMSSNLSGVSLGNSDTQQFLRVVTWQP